MTPAALAVGALLAATLATSLSLNAQDAAGFLRKTPFIEKHCAECHDDLTTKAGLDLTGLPFDPEDGANFATWVRVHDRAKAG
ncbi:MAG: hypothetical protein HC814_01735 [Rhodobacteraceae bacterium]|nr:hypothetical protein [Paracoccaceae bacterium]